MCASGNFLYLSRFSHDRAVEIPMRRSSRMQEFRVALAIALALAATCFGAAVISAGFIAR